MEEYYDAKKSLFTQKLKSGAKKSVIGVDDDYGRRLKKELGSKAVSFSLSADADFQASEIQFSRKGLSFSLALSSEVGQPRDLKVSSPLVSSPLLGVFNAQNVLGVLAVAWILDLDLAQTIRTLAQAKGAPGRLERVGQNDDYLVLVDYSHTPASVAAALESLRLLEPRKILCVFGCGGDRDKGKRPKMAIEAGQKADLAILTSDNPRTEDPLAIITEAEAGFALLHLTRASLANQLDGHFTGYLVEPDRRKAIQVATQVMNKGDILLIAGKGHEDYQIIGTTKRRFDDREEALTALTAWGKA
jgi:UDP-N-acetylmuramoyl-L-alanyl-D-glutamate--2,6-diaminopimelate ligase